VLFRSGLPGVRDPLTKFGALEAGWEAAEAALREGGIVVVYPGGDHEAFRPWNVRNQIDFDGRTGFIKLALRTGVPIVPAVTHGVQDSIMVLSRGEKLATVMPHLRRRRLKVMPIMVGMPWGLSFGLPTLPLPSKATVQLGPPIDLTTENGAAAANDEPYVKACYERVTGSMQSTLDKLASERNGKPWPISLL